jgi:hypothetical protein
MLHLTTSHRPKYDATNNGDRPCLLRKLISAPELSKHLTIAQCSRCDATNNGDCPPLVQISMYLTNKDNHHCV